jgi:signal transduction histidine kinase/DNA-binding response OmpR family regulator/ligand-binding sensor domain-containing protein
MAGLDRYDGYSVKHFQNVSGDPHSLSSNIVYALALDSRERLWVGTYGTGLGVYDPRKDRFVNLLPRNGDSSWYSAKGIYAIREDRAGNLWLGTEDRGVVCVELPNDQKAADLDSLAGRVRMTTYSLGTRRNTAHDLCVWNDGRIFAGSDSGIVVITPGTHATSRLVPRVSGASQLCSAFVSSISPDGNGSLWVGTLDQGAFLVDPEANRILNYRHSEGSKLSIKSSEVHHIHQDPRGDLWFATAKGLDMFSPSTGQSVPYLAFGPGPQESNCWWLSTDNTGTLWIGTEVDGLYQLSEKSLRYPLFSLPDSQGLPRPFEGIERDKKGGLWVSSCGEVMRLDIATRRVLKRYSVFREDQSVLTGHDASASYIDMKGDFWYGSNETGLYKINLTSGRIHHYTYASHGGTTSPVRSIAPASGGDLWISTRLDPLMRFDGVTGQFKPVRGDSILYAFHVLNDRDGTLWISSEIYGLLHFNPASGLIERFTNDPNDSRSLSNGLVYKSYQDPSGRLWVGAGVVMNLWDPLTRKSTRFPNPGIARSTLVFPLGTDSRGRLLVGSSECVSTLDPSTGRYVNLDASDGFCADPVDMDTLPDGTVLVTGTGGINIFSADSLTPHRTPPLLVITGLTVNDEFVPPPSMQSGKGSLDLTYVQNVLELQFAATDIVSPDLVRYHYRLEGLERNWVDTKDRRYVRYAGLPPGEYVFKVKAVSSRGEWPDQEIALEVSIAPPWWRSPGAFALYVVLMLGLLAIAYEVRLKQLRLKQQVEMEHFQSERLAEVDKLKSRFFANVSHEFRTPLTLITGPIEDLLSSSGEPATRRKLDLIRNNAQKVLNLVTQLLDFSRLESGAMKLQVASYDIVRFLHRTTMSFESWAERNGINLRFQCEAESANGFFDGDKLEKIVDNLLSNALKFTATGGAVDVLVRFTSPPDRPRAGLTPLSLQGGELGRGNESIEITVSDTGPGISAEHLPHIFDRFYRADETHTTEGTGIGLALTKELIDLHHGAIAVKSAPGKGSEFTLTLPIKKSAYREDEIAGPQPEVRRHELHPVLGSSKRPGYQRSTPPAEGKPIVLIVEDNADLRLYIREYLEAEYSVREAVDGKEGFERAAETVPDIVISDVMMPEMDGLELCRALKHDVRTSHVPVILLTARAGTDSKIEGLEAGADDYLTKPFDSKELAVRVHNLIEQRLQLRKKFSDTVVLKPGEVKVASQEDAFLKRLMEAVEERIDDENFSVEELGVALNMSRVQLHRKVTALTNLSAGEFIRSMRLHRAMDLLKCRAGSVSEVAFRVGFKDPSHFSKRFHEHFGVTPSDILKNSKNGTPANTA